MPSPLVPSTLRRPLALGLSVLAGTLVGLATPPPAAACSIAAPQPYGIDFESDDTTAPAAPSGPTVKAVHRGVGPQCDARGVCSSTSCDDIASIQLAWTPGGDDTTADGDLGVRVRVVSGTAPEGLWPVDDAVETGAAGSFTLTWIDGATDDQEALDFVVEVTELDRAGNESTPVEVHVTHAGASESDKDASGCAVVGPEGGLGLLALVLPALIGRRRMPH